jgi:endoglucanase
MKKTATQLSYAAAAVAVIALFTASVWAQSFPVGSPVATHGLLRTEGNRVVNASGNPVQLRGMSLFWSQGRDARQFYNATSIGHLRNDWNADVVRAAMGVNQNWAGDEQSYLSDRQGNLNRVRAVIEAGRTHGMYVIVDWHAYYQHPNNQSNSLPPVQEAIDFFVGLSNQYPQASNPHIIWEIFNEPVGPHQADGGGSAATQFWNNRMVPWLQPVARAIRANNDNRLIITGTPFFCQAPDIASDNPLRMANGSLIPHVAYSAHFYAAGTNPSTPSGINDHNMGLKQRIIRTMMVHRLPIFVSEWGTVAADGAGTHDAARSGVWMDFLRQYQIGWAAWSFSSQNQTSAAFNTGTPAAPSSPWPTSQISTSGNFLRNELRNTTQRTSRFFSVDPRTQGNGTVSGANRLGPFEIGGASPGTISLQAVPESGYMLSRWDGLPANLATTNPVTFTPAPAGTGVNRDMVVTAVFTRIEGAAQDNLDISAALAFVMGRPFAAMLQANGNDVAAARAHLNGIIAAWPAASMHGVTVSIVDSIFTPAVAGTVDNVPGTNGIFRFSLVLSKGQGTPQTLSGRSFNINATRYTPGASTTPRYTGQHRVAWGMSNLAGGSGVRLHGPADAGATVMLYDTRGRVVRRLPAQDGMVIGSGVGSGNYLLIIRNGAGQEVYRSRVALMN